jgi:hypothetical protein
LKRDEYPQHNQNDLSYGVFQILVELTFFDHTLTDFPEEEKHKVWIDL